MLSSRHKFWLYYLTLSIVLALTLIRPASAADTVDDHPLLGAFFVSHAMGVPAPLLLASRGKKRVALYIRVSTDRQAEEGRSPESQLQDMQAYCRRKGWEREDHETQSCRLSPGFDRRSG